jgi:hypothetical protein
VNLTPLRLALGTVLLASCAGTGAGPSGEAPSGGGADGDEERQIGDEAVTDPRERAEAGGWSSTGLMPIPFYCNDEGGTEWCDGLNDDDCDGQVDEGCADCVRNECIRHRISAEEVRQGASREGEAECVGAVYCGRADGYATTSPPGGCGDFHCGTIVWSDGTAQPHRCTVYGRCAGGAFTAKGFSW